MASNIPIAQSARAVEYTECISAEKKDSPNVLDMTLNHPTAKLQSVELRGILSTPSLPLFPGPLSLGGGSTW